MLYRRVVVFVALRSLKEGVGRNLINNNGRGLHYPGGGVAFIILRVVPLAQAHSIFN